jgi:hypothetical protein
MNWNQLKKAFVCIKFFWRKSMSEVTNIGDVYNVDKQSFINKVKGEMRGKLVTYIEKNITGAEELLNYSKKGEPFNEKKIEEVAGMIFDGAHGVNTEIFSDEDIKSLMKIQRQLNIYKIDEGDSKFNFKENAKAVYKEINMMQKLGVIVITPDSKHYLHDLLSYYTSEMHRCSNEGEPISENIKWVGKIIGVLGKDDTHLTMTDDPHLIMTNVIFSTLYDSVDLLESAMNRGGISLTEYNKEILPIIVQKCLDNLRDPNIAGPFLAETCKSISTAELEQILVSSEVKKIPDNAETLLGLRHWFLETLPTCLNQQPGIHFGVTLEQTSPWAIPFNGPNSPSLTQFGDPLEQVTKTILSYKTQKIPYGFIASVRTTQKEQLLPLVPSHMNSENVDFPEQYSEYLFSHPELQKQFVQTFLFPLFSEEKSSETSKTFTGLSGKF